MVGDILQPTHLLFILVIALVVLGPKRLPEVGKSLGKGLRDFRSALKENDPREDLMQLNEQTMAPIHAAPPAHESVAPAPEPVTTVAPAAHAPVPEPVATAASASQAPSAEQHESD